MAPPNGAAKNSVHQDTDCQGNWYSAKFLDLSRNIVVLSNAVRRAKLGDKDEFGALRRLVNLGHT